MRVKRGEKSALTVKNKRRERYDDDGLRVRGQPAFVDFPSGFDLNPNSGRLASWIGNSQDGTYINSGLAIFHNR